MGAGNIMDGPKTPEIKPLEVLDVKVNKIINEKIEGLVQKLFRDCFSDGVRNVMFCKNNLEIYICFNATVNLLRLRGYDLRYFSVYGNPIPSPRKIYYPMRQNFDEFRQRMASYIYRECNTISNKYVEMSTSYPATFNLIYSNFFSQVEKSVRQCCLRVYSSRGVQTLKLSLLSFRVWEYVEPGEIYKIYNNTVAWKRQFPTMTLNLDPINIEWDNPLETDYKKYLEIPLLRYEIILRDGSNLRKLNGIIQFNIEVPNILGIFVEQMGLLEDELTTKRDKYKVIRESIQLSERLSIRLSKEQRTGIESEIEKELSSELFFISYNPDLLSCERRIEDLYIRGNSAYLIHYLEGKYERLREFVLPVQKMHLLFLATIARLQEVPDADESIIRNHLHILEDTSFFNDELYTEEKLYWKIWDWRIRRKPYVKLCEYFGYTPHVDWEVKALLDKLDTLSFPYKVSMPSSLAYALVSPDEGKSRLRF